MVSRLVKGLLGLYVFLCALNAQASVIFYTDQTLFENAIASATLTDFEGIVTDGQTLTNTSFTYQDVNFKSIVLNSPLSVCGAQSCVGNPFDSAILFDPTLGDTLVITLPTSGSAITAAGGLFGGTSSGGGSASAILNVFGPSGLLETQNVTVGDMGFGQAHTFFGWTAAAGDEITRIEFQITDGIHRATLDNFQHGAIATPVPPAFWLFASGLFGLVGIGRRRQARG